MTSGREPVAPTRMRAAIARRMAQSKKQAPHFYVTSEIEMDAVLEAVARLNHGRPFMRSRPGTDPTVVDALERMEDRLDRLIAIGEQTNELLERAERLSAPQPAQTDVPDQPEDPRAAERTSRPAPTQGPRRRRTKSTGGRRQRPAKRADQPAQVAAPVKLHEAIIQVLLDAREPLTANDLAARIRERNLFEPPRSGHELRGGQVSARVGNSHYRDRFARRDGRIWLADPEGDRV